MNPTIIPTRAILILAATLMFAFHPAGAEDRSEPDVTAGAAATDLLVARPGGVAATVLGAAIFVVGLPFTLINGSTEQAAQTLVAQPARYTFSRPLGQNIRGLGKPQD
ncbi:MAG: hypothetical protein LM523_07980 [Candidatus Contendobacter sp.]|nr:hypothetical protein [Candidatus Contendobacter sp.]